MTPLQLTRSVLGLNRLRQIAVTLTRHGFGHIVAGINLSRFLPVWMLRRRTGPASSAEAPSSIGRRLAMVCSDLGPTFIKLGQLISTRPDIVPPDVLSELRKLQDDVSPFDPEIAKSIIVEELGQPLTQAFASFVDEPIASGSIGQAHRARTAGGDDVIVKVRRPDIESTIRLDMQLLAWLAKSLEELMPELKPYQPSMLIAELEQMLISELDFVTEASTTARFAAAMRDDSKLKIPKVYWELCGTRVLTLERLPGVNVDRVLREDADRQGDAEGDGERVDRTAIARRLADGYLTQIFEIGVFHADPHPGNILIERPSTVGLIDFGQVGTITEEFLTELVVLIYACTHSEMELAIDTLADMGAVGPNVDRRLLAREMQGLIDKYYGLPVKRLELTKLVADFVEMTRRHDVIMPRLFSQLLKAVGTVSGIITTLDPELNLLELVQPRLKKALRAQLSPAHMRRVTSRWSWDLLTVVRQAPRQLRDTLRRVATGTWQLNVRHENIDRLINELDRSSNRLSFSIVIAAIIVGSSVVISTDADISLLGFPLHYLGIAGYVIAGVLGLGLSWAIFRSGRLH